MAKVQFNLLPDTKLNSLRAQQSSKQIVRIAILVAGSSFVLFLVLLIGVKVFQKSQLAAADSSIKSATTQIESIDNIDGILTVQNQLSTVADLHAKKYIASRLFTYLGQVTPANVGVNGLSLDLTESTLQIDGTADSQHSINGFIDAMKLATYSVDGQDDQRAFTSVIESSFAITSKDVTFTLDVQFTPQLFANNLNGSPKLKVRQ